MKIFVVGSLNMDLVIKAPFIPENGVTITGSNFLKNSGGKGANQATAISKAGGNAYIVGCVGNSFGDELIETLNKYNVNTNYVEKLDNISSGIAVILVVDGDNRIILDTGANGKVSTEIIDKALSGAQKGDFLICQNEINEDACYYAMKKAKEKEMTTIFNPAPARELSSEIFKNIDYFIPNQSECKFYTSIFPDSDENIRKSVDKLQKLGVKNLIITLGEKGAVYANDKQIIYVPCFKVDAVDTTAAGDTFVGYFATMLSEGKDVKTAMTIASKASSITVTRKGAQQSIPCIDEIKL